ncbi:MAG: FMN-binding protein [Spirochaetaceae bacterium]|nr:MAG: FMN-binding protein [Spirochaetaceae bacterium]
MNKQSIPYTMLFTFLISFLFVLLLSFAHQGTAPLVQRNREIARQRSVLAAIGISVTEEEEIRRRFSEVEQLEREGMTLFRSEVEGRTVYAKEFSGAGLWGPISGVLAVRSDLERTVGLEIVDQNETPGLGGRITEQWFKDQLRDLRIVDGTVRVGPPGEGTTDKEDGMIDAVTGATRTSESMGTILHREIRRIAEAVGEEI